MPDRDSAGRPASETDVGSRDKQQPPAKRKQDDEIGKINGSPTPLPDEKAVESGARRVRGDPPTEYESIF